MRDGIMNQLPEIGEKKVLVVGPPNGKGMNTLKRTIDQLNRPKEWIVTEFRETVNHSRVSEKFALVLTMYGTSGSALVNVRESARRQNIHFPLHALTCGETKEILERIDPRKFQRLQEVEKKQAIQSPNPLPQVVNKSDDGIIHLAEIPPCVNESKTALNGHSTEVPVPKEVPTVSSEPSDDAHAEAVLEKFAGYFVEVQVAVMLVREKNAELRKNIMDLQAISEERQSVIQRLTAESVAMQAELSEIRKESDQHRKEAEKLRMALDEFDKLIAGARKK